MLLYSLKEGDKYEICFLVTFMCFYVVFSAVNNVFNNKKMLFAPLYQNDSEFLYLRPFLYTLKNCRESQSQFTIHIL